MKINKEWHRTHKMQTKPSVEERIAWHLEHSKNCDCHKMPPQLEIILRNNNGLNS